MLNTKQYKTLRLISSFSDIDYIQFEKFIKSPFFNERESLIKIFFYIKKYLINNSYSEFDFKIMNKDIFPGEIYCNIKTRKRLSSLNKLIEKYFSYINLQMYYSPEKVHKLKEINKRGLSEIFFKGMSDFRKGMTDDVYSDLICQMDYLKILYEEYRMYKSIYKPQMAMNTFSQIRDTINSMSVFFFLLNSSIGLINKFRELNYNNNFDNLNVFISENHDTIEKYKHLRVLKDFCLLINNDKFEKIYEISEYILLNHKDIFYGITDLVFNLMLEYVVFKYYMGIEADKKTYNVLIESMQKSGFISRSKLIPPMNFIIIVIICINSNQKDNAQRFIKNFFKSLNESLRQNILKISEATYRFSVNDFKNTVEILKNINTDYYMIYIITRTLLIQSYFEYGNLSNANKISESLKRYIYRNKEITEMTRHVVLKFLHYIQKIIFARRNMFKKYDKVLNQIYNESNLIRKEWLISKAIETFNQREKLVKS